MGNGTRKPSRSTPLSRVDQGPDSASAVRHSHDQVTVSFRVEAAGIPIGTVCPDRAPKRGILVDVPRAVWAGDQAGKADQARHKNLHSSKGWAGWVNEKERVSRC